VVRDYDGDSRPRRPLPPIPITVDQHFAMGPGGVLQMLFDADHWGSTISFAPGVPVTLGCLLELTYAPGVNLAGEIGRTFVVFDWTGVNPTGAFAVTSPYTWDVSKLYTTGEVTLSNVPGLLLPGDFNRNGQLSANDLQAMLSAMTDLNAYKTAYGLSDSALQLLADSNGDHAVTNADIQGLLNRLINGDSAALTVPEPTSFVLSALGLLSLVADIRRRQR